MIEIDGQYIFFDDDPWTFLGRERDNHYHEFKSSVAKLGFSWNDAWKLKY